MVELTAALRVARMAASRAVSLVGMKAGERAG
jgi:hypothetical protein